MPGSKTDVEPVKPLTIEDDLATVELVLELGHRRHAYRQEVLDGAMAALQRLYERRD